MHIYKLIKGLNAASLTVGIALTSFAGFSFFSIDEAQAQYKSSGVQLKRGSVNRGSRVRNTTGISGVKRRGSIDPLIRSVNNPLYVKREVFDAVRGARSGVRLNGLRPSNQNNNGIRLIQREIQVQRQNEQTLRRNELRKLQGSLRRTRPNGRFLTRQEQIDLLNSNQVLDEQGISNQGASGYSGGVTASTCPSGHNCGYRIYDNGTGPRIIRPNVQIGNDLPSFDGLNGPKIITLD